MMQGKNRRDNEKHEIHVTEAADPNALADKLNGSLSFKRNQGVATVHDCDIHCSFEGMIPNQKLLRACAQTVRRWAKADPTFDCEEHHRVQTQPKASKSGATYKTSLFGSSTDMVCPTCGKTSNGTRGLASHGRSFLGQAGAAEADKEQAPEQLGS